MERTAIRVVPERDVVKAVRLALIAVKDVKDAPADVALVVLEIVGQVAVATVKVAARVGLQVNRQIDSLKFLNLIWKFQMLQ